eukprot:2422478-Amphidinium_carterae.1
MDKQSQKNEHRDRDKEATAWAKKLKKSGHAAGTACLYCKQAAGAWPGLEWENIVAKAKTDPEFKAQHAKAAMVARQLQLPPPAAFEQQQLDEVSRTGLRVEKEFVFITCKDFKIKYGIEASAVPDVSVVELEVETGKLERGVLVHPEHAERKVFIYHDSSYCLNTVKHSGARQLRANEGKDWASFYLDNPEEEQHK